MIPEVNEVQHDNHRICQTKQQLEITLYQTTAVTHYCKPNGSILQVKIRVKAFYSIKTSFWRTQKFATLRILLEVSLV